MSNFINKFFKGKEITNSNKDNFNLSKQVKRIYLTSTLGGLSITGAWVAILAARGFSLVEIGFVEMIFHITSLICEIPSGMLADLYGRRRMLVMSSILMTIGNMLMIFSGGLPTICLAFVFVAMSYNAESGTLDALVYDSMKIKGEEKSFEKFNSNITIIYRITNAISTLCAGLALVLGYRLAYSIDVVIGVVNLFLICKVVEVKIDDKTDKDNENSSKDNTNIFKKLIDFFVESIKFLKDNSKATKLMFVNSFVGALDVLLLFFLQSKLEVAGIPNELLGVALFVMQLGGVVGAKIIIKGEKVRYIRILVLTLSGVVLGILLEHTMIIALMVLGGFISSMSDDMIEIRTNTKLQEMFPSEMRATLVSISSFTFSVVMIVLSPLAGYFFSIW